MATPFSDTEMQMHRMIYVVMPQHYSRLKSLLAIMIMLKQIAFRDTYCTILEHRRSGIRHGMSIESLV